MASLLIGACARPSPPTALPPPSHTVDSADFVDNAGRTGDERNRTEFSGMRGSETGSQQPVGTPGSGFPIPIEPQPERRASKESSAGAAAGTNGSVTVERAAVESASRAHCEREQRCRRLKEESTRSCLLSANARYAETFRQAGCPYSFDTAKVVSCVSAIRDASCNVAPDALLRLEACDASTICVAQ